MRQTGVVRPRELPSVRDELHSWLDHPHTRNTYRTLGSIYGWMGRRDLPSKVSDDLLDAERRIMRMGELFYVSSDMTDVAEAAGATLPNFALRREDLPADRGLLVFDRPIGTWTDETNGREASVIACSWGCGVLPSPFPPDYLLINFYTWRDLNVKSAIATGSATADDLSVALSQPALVHDNESGVQLGVDHDMPPSTTILGTWGRTVMAAWLLMQQPGVSTRQPYHYNRLDQTWLKRRRLSQSAITVVRLRYASSVGTGTGDNASREYHHRWMVRGHWRKQWYPSRGSHVPIWISPHIKGPEGAPIKAGEKVNAWVR